MRKYALFCISLLALVIQTSTFAGEVGWEEIVGGETGIKTVLVDPSNDSIIYFGSTKGIFLSRDKGINWKSVFLSRGQNRVINFLGYDKGNGRLIYAASGGGLLYTDNQGETWRKIFKGKDYQENNCTAVAAFSGQIYLGTENGLFISKDNGRTWHKPGGKLKNNHILAIAHDTNNPACAYIVGFDGLFKTIDNGQSWERIFISGTHQEDSQNEEAGDNQDESVTLSDVRYIVLDNKQNCLYLATVRGVYRSIDRGLTWDSLSDYGLLERNVRFLFISPDSKLCALTKKGVFRYEDQRWYEYSQGMASSECNFIDADKKGNFYIATNRGLFKSIPIAVPRNEVFIDYYKGEPEIRAVQDAAIRYAEVSPEKIIQWRRQAAKKAFFPRVSASVNQNVSDLWHWETGSSARVGDDTLVQGKPAVEWAFTLSWDLSEIIWNSEQASIDVRSRLMVQLRDDIVDEVTKLYFERARIKMELDNVDIIDRKKRFEKELKLQELTASLDGLTGGYFSRQLKN